MRRCLLRKRRLPHGSCSVGRQCWGWTRHRASGCCNHGCSRSPRKQEQIAALYLVELVGKPRFCLDAFERGIARRRARSDATRKRDQNEPPHGSSGCNRECDEERRSCDGPQNGRDRGSINTGAIGAVYRQRGELAMLLDGTEGQKMFDNSGLVLTRAAAELHGID